MNNSSNREQFSTGVIGVKGFLVPLWENTPQPSKGTLTPLIPLSLRAYKGEGEKKQRQRLALMRQPLPLVRYLGEGMDSGSGAGMAD